MRAIEFIEHIQKIIDVHGDVHVKIDGGDIMDIKYDCRRSCTKEFGDIKIVTIVTDVRRESPGAIVVGEDEILLTAEDIKEINRLDDDVDAAIHYLKISIQNYQERLVYNHARV